MIAKQTVFLTGDRSKAVPEGHEEAKFLLVREGCNIEDALAEKHGAVALIDAPAEKKAVEPQQQEPPVLKGDAPPASAPAAAPVAGKAPKAPKAKKAAMAKKKR